MSKPLPLVIENLTHAFAGSEDAVLQDIHLHVAPGEFLAILGPSGCGKSTLLRAVAGLVTPQRGSIYINGKKVAAHGREYIPARERHVGMVFQDYALFPYMTVVENIAFGLQHQCKGLSKQAITQRVDELLELIDMTAYATRMPSELSGGQQQRVALARALAPKPSILLLDEPFANVDANLRQTLGEQLQMLVKHEGVSVLMVTHDRQEAFALADKVAILDNCLGYANIVQCDTPETIYEKPVNVCAAELAGPALLLKAQTEGLKAQTSFGELTLLNPSKGERTLLIRPEMVRFKQSTQGNAKIVARTYQGHHYHLLCETPWGKILVDHLDKFPPALGALGEVSVDTPCWVLPQT